MPKLFISNFLTLLFGDNQRAKGEGM